MFRHIVATIRHGEMFYPCSGVELFGVKHIQVTNMAYRSSPLTISQDFSHGCYLLPPIPNCIIFSTHVAYSVAQLVSKLRCDIAALCYIAL